MYYTDPARSITAYIGYMAYIMCIIYMISMIYKIYKVPLREVPRGVAQGI